MMKYRTMLFTVWGATLLILSMGALQAAPGDEAVTNIKRMVGYIRYSETKPEFAQKAMEFVGIEEMTKMLLGSSYARAKPQELDDFRAKLAEYIQLKAFPVAIKYFKDIDISYGEPVVKGNQISVKSSIVYAGSERIEFTWVSTQLKDKIVLTDFLDEKGTSVMKANRDGQIQPLLRKGGMKTLLAQFEKILRSLRKS